MLNIGNLGAWRRNAAAAPSGYLVDYDVSSSIPAGCTFTRAATGNTASLFNSSGTMEFVGADVPRFDYDPVTLALKGLLIEPQATNVIPNSIASGSTNGVIGSGGAAPTSWSITTNGLTVEIIGSGTDSGRPYVDIKWSGTTVSQFPSVSVFGAATVGDNMFARWQCKRTDGTITTQTQTLRLVDGTTFGNSSGSPTAINTSTYTDVIHNRILSAGNTLMSSGLRRVVVNGTAVDETVRFSLPQLEVGKRTSNIPTSGSAVTRFADNLAFTIPSGVATLRFQFDDDSTQDVSVSAGAYTVPTNLNRPHLKRIRSLETA